MTEAVFLGRVCVKFTDSAPEPCPGTVSVVGSLAEYGGEGADWDFKSHLWDRCLNANLCSLIEDARKILEASRADDNTE
jgi:hypothetical protein